MGSLLGCFWPFGCCSELMRVVGSIDAIVRAEGWLRDLDWTDVAGRIGLVGLSMFWSFP